MERWQDKVAVVTGASSGIGAALCERLVNFGIRVVGLARRKELIEEHAKRLTGKSGVLHAVRADLTKEEDIVSAFEWITSNVGPIHILINNAGQLPLTNLINGDANLWKECLDLNVMGLCISTREAVKNMRANGVNGHIVHINSIVGHYCYYFPYASVYTASKHAVVALSETLRQELQAIGSKIKISNISPGLVLTSRSQSNMNDHGYIENGQFIEESDVVDGICYILGTPPHVQVHELLVRPKRELP